MALPSPVSDQPANSNAAILSAQVVMSDILWHAIDGSQRHSIAHCHNYRRMTIGARIRQSREALGMSRPELARASGIPYPTLAGIENTDQGSSTRLHAIAKALRVRVDWLETGKGSRDDVDTAPQSESQSPRLDADMLAETHKACRVFAERQGRQFSLEADPARFLQVYMMRAKLPARPSQDELIEFGASLATIMTMPQGANADGRNDGVPVTGTDEQGVARGGRRRKA